MASGRAACSRTASIWCCTGTSTRPRSSRGRAPDHDLLVLAAGCLYEGDEGHRYPNACQVIALDLNDEGRPERAVVRFRGWAERNDGLFWGDDGLLLQERAERSAGAAPRAARVARRRRKAAGGAMDARFEHCFRGTPQRAGCDRARASPRPGRAWRWSRCRAWRGSARAPGGRVLSPARGAVRLRCVAGCSTRRSQRASTPVSSRSPRRPASIETAPRRVKFPLSWRGNARWSTWTTSTVPRRRRSVELLDRLPGLPAIVTGRYTTLGSTPSTGWTRVEVECLDADASVAMLRAELGVGFTGRDRATRAGNDCRWLTARAPPRCGLPAQRLHRGRIPGTAPHVQPRARPR